MRLFICKCVCVCLFVWVSVYSNIYKKSFEITSSWLWKRYYHKDMFLYSKLLMKRPYYRFLLFNWVKATTQNKHMIDNYMTTETVFLYCKQYRFTHRKTKRCPLCIFYDAGIFRYSMQNVYFLFGVPEKHKLNE